jgi:hypothetical protein
MLNAIRVLRILAIYPTTSAPRAGIDVCGLRVACHLARRINIHALHDECASLRDYCD